MPETVLNRPEGAASGQTPIGSAASRPAHVGGLTTAMALLPGAALEVGGRPLPSRLLRLLRDTLPDHIGRMISSSNNSSRRPDNSMPAAMSPGRSRSARPHRLLAPGPAVNGRIWPRERLDLRTSWNLSSPVSESRIAARTLLRHGHPDPRSPYPGGRRFGMREPAAAPLRRRRCPWTRPACRNTWSWSTAP